LPRRRVGAVEAIELEGSLRKWASEHRQFVFPNGVGRIGRYGAFHELV
jgi:hypothetical protein